MIIKNHLDIFAAFLNIFAIMLIKTKANMIGTLHYDFKEVVPLMFKLVTKWVLLHLLVSRGYLLNSMGYINYK